MEMVRTQQRQKIHPHKFSLWVAMASIIMMFAGLTSAYIVKSSQAGWEEVITPDYFWYSTVAIVISSITIQMALRAFKQRAMQQYRLLLGVTFLLGIAFVVLQSAGFNWMWDHGVRFKGAGAGQFLYIIAGLHALHVIGGIIAILFQLVKALFGRTKNYNAVPVEVVSTYWHFVDVLWIYLLVFFIVIG
ncbi:MAG TPA: heme-copper oxidase subunit III [Flavisolibacter sp.]|nr:heme-copper oxidase subunit III [Flavisolibacter sp.]